MFATIVPVAEAAIPYYALRRLLAVFMSTPDLLGRHAAAHRQGDVDHREMRNVQRGEG